MNDNNAPGRPTLLQQPKQITVNVEFEVYEALVARARVERLPMSELVRRAIDNELGKNRNGPGGC